MLSACRDKNQPDAYGNFETTEVVVSAETSGQLLWFKADEGQPLAHGQLVGVIDTTQLALQQRQLSAQRSAGASRVSEVGQQLDALRVQHEIAGRNYERVKRLFAEQAATAGRNAFLIAVGVDFAHGVPLFGASAPQKVADRHDYYL